MSQSKKKGGNKGSKKGQPGQPAEIQLKSGGRALTAQMRRNATTPNWSTSKTRATNEGGGLAVNNPTTFVHHFVNGTHAQQSADEQVRRLLQEAEQRKQQRAKVGRFDLLRCACVTMSYHTTMPCHAMLRAHVCVCVRVCVWEGGGLCDLHTRCFPHSPTYMHV